MHSQAEPGNEKRFGHTVTDDLGEDLRLDIFPAEQLICCSSFPGLRGRPQYHPTIQSILLGETCTIVAFQRKGRRT